MITKLKIKEEWGGDGVIKQGKRSTETNDNSLSTGCSWIYVVVFCVQFYGSLLLFNSGQDVETEAVNSWD